MFDKWGYAGGATDDWYSSAGIAYSYTWELPEADRNLFNVLGGLIIFFVISDGFHGFKLPAKNIKRVGEHLFVGFMRLAKYIAKRKKL